MTIRYRIEAEAIDASGESHKADLNLSISNRPVRISYTLKSMYERKEPLIINAVASNEFAGRLQKKLTLKLYRKKYSEDTNDDHPAGDFYLKNGTWYYAGGPKQYKTVPPDTAIVYEASFLSNEETLTIPPAILAAGDYIMEVSCRDSGFITGSSFRNFSVFDEAENTFSFELDALEYLPVSAAGAGQKIKWVFGTRQKNIYSIYHASYYARSNNHTVLKNEYFIPGNQNGISTWEYTVPANVLGNIQLTHVYVRDNKLYSDNKTLLLAEKSRKLQGEIIVEQYRKILVPGGKETFLVSVKTDNVNTAAELMTVLYDASLDKIQSHEWLAPDDDVRYNLYVSWPGINTAAGKFASYPADDTKQNTGKIQRPLWWLPPMDYLYLGESEEIGYSTLAGKVSGINIAGGRLGLEEVVVTGYGTSRKADLTGSLVSVRIRGASSLSEYNIPLVVMDGIVYEGDISKINVASITDGLILKGADAVALYGAKAADGVLVISTKGPLVLAPPSEPPVIPARKNFFETAFFISQLHADAKGNYTINFTMPESVTEWNWKLLAYTKSAQFMYAQRKIITQLPLMLQPDLPRFLYQGDVLKLPGRITNADTADLPGTAYCKIEDAVTGEDITSLLTTASSQDFAVNKKKNETIFLI